MTNEEIISGMTHSNMDALRDVLRRIQRLEQVVAFLHEQERHRAERYIPPLGWKLPREKP